MKSLDIINAAFVLSLHLIGIKSSNFLYEPLSTEIKLSEEVRDFIYTRDYKDMETLEFLRIYLEKETTEWIVKEFTMDALNEILELANRIVAFYQKYHCNIQLMYKRYVGINHPTYGGTRGIYKLQQEPVTNKDIAYMMYYVYLLKPNAKEIGFYNFVEDEETILQIEDIDEHLRRLAKTQVKITGHHFGVVKTDELRHSYEEFHYYPEDNSIVTKKNLIYPCKCGNGTIELSTIHQKDKPKPYSHQFNVKKNCINDCRDYEPISDFGEKGWFISTCKDEFVLVNGEKNVKRKESKI